MSMFPQTHSDSDESLCRPGDVSGNIDMSTRGHLDGVDLGTTSTNDPSHQVVGDGELHHPEMEDKKESHERLDTRDHNRTNRFNCPCPKMQWTSD